jgi:hypothetical protein
LSGGTTGRGSVDLEPASLEQRFANRTWQPTDPLRGSVSLTGTGGSVTIALQGALGMAIYSPTGQPSSRSVIRATKGC